MPGKVIMMLHKMIAHHRYLLRTKRIEVPVHGLNQIAWISMGRLRA